MKFLNTMLMILNDEVDPTEFLNAKKDEYESVKKIIPHLALAKDLDKQKLQQFLIQLAKFKVF